MTMTLNGKPVRDAAPFVDWYRMNGLNTSLLEKCNRQTFNYIDGVGKGFFIQDNALYTKGQTLLWKASPTNVQAQSLLYVVNVVEIEHPDSTNLKTRIICTEEPKHLLDSKTVLRNYNVIDRRTQISNTAALVSPDGPTAKTIQQIIQDFTGLTVNWHPSYVFYPYDVFIQDMTQADAIDNLCRAYGLVWSFDASGTIHIWSVTGLTEPDYQYIKDIRQQMINPPLSYFGVVYPTLDCCVQVPNSFYAKDWSSTDEGIALKVYQPYYPAIYDTYGTIQNSAYINSLSDAMRVEFQGINQVVGNYLVKEYYLDTDIDNNFPQTLKLTYADNGAGPRTYFTGESYPFWQVPVPDSKDRQCKRWIGALQQTYRGSVARFPVTPLYGLDGNAPSGTQAVTNLFKWDYGAAGAMVYVDWDCVNYRWIATQQEYVCPPPGDPTTITNPSDPTYNPLKPKD